MGSPVVDWEVLAHCLCSDNALCAGQGVIYEWNLLGGGSAS